MTEPRSGKPVIGIVGGIGAGKSSVAAEFVRLGCTLVDGDAIGHALLSEADIRRQLLRRWGRGILNAGGSVNREALGHMVFEDSAGLAELNRIMHPCIRRRMTEQIRLAQADPDARAIVLDAAVLFEAHWEDLCTHTIFVSAPDSERLRRAQEARGWDEKRVLAREKSQISLDKKGRRCDYTIDNSSSVSYLREQVRKLFHEIVHAADRP